MKLTKYEILSISPLIEMVKSNKDINLQQFSRKYLEGAFINHYKPQDSIALKELQDLQLELELNPLAILTWAKANTASPKAIATIALAKSGLRYYDPEYGFPTEPPIIYYNQGIAVIDNKKFLTDTMIAIIAK